VAVAQELGDRRVFRESLTDTDDEFATDGCGEPGS
jgi:hypothetical protein